MFWRFPFILEPSIRDQITNLSRRIKEFSNYMFSMPQLSSSHIIISPNWDIHAGGWISEDRKTLLLIVVNGNEELPIDFKIIIKDLTSLGLVYGVGETDRGKESRIFIENGVFEGNLKEFDVGIFIFKR